MLETIKIIAVEYIVNKIIDLFDIFLLLLIGFSKYFYIMNPVNTDNKISNISIKYCSIPKTTYKFK